MKDSASDSTQFLRTISRVDDETLESLKVSALKHRTLYTVALVCTISFAIAFAGLIIGAELHYFQSLNWIPYSFLGVFTLVLMFWSIAEHTVYKSYQSDVQDPFVVAEMLILKSISIESNNDVNDSSHFLLNFEKDIEFKLIDTHPYMLQVDEAYLVSMFRASRIIRQVKSTDGEVLIKSKNIKMSRA